MKRRYLIVSLFAIAFFVMAASAFGQISSPSKTIAVTPQAASTVSAKRTTGKRKTRTETVDNNETITVHKSKGGVTANRTSSTPQPAIANPKKIKHFIGGSDDGSSIRPASGDISTSETRKARAGVEPKKTREQDIEVENDETHWVGHDRTKRGQTVGSKTIRSPRPATTRVKKSPTSTGDQPEMTRTKPRKRAVRHK